MSLQGKSNFIRYNYNITLVKYNYLVFNFKKTYFV